MRFKGRKYGINSNKTIRNYCEYPVSVNANRENDRLKANLTSESNIIEDSSNIPTIKYYWSTHKLYQRADQANEGSQKHTSMRLNYPYTKIIKTRFLRRRRILETEEYIENIRISKGRKHNMIINRKAFPFGTINLIDVRKGMDSTLVQNKTIYFDNYKKVARDYSSSKLRRNKGKQKIKYVQMKNMLQEVEYSIDYFDEYH